MNEDRMPTDGPDADRNWLDRIAQAFRREPRDRQDLRDVLKEARDRALLDQDALGMIEGVLDVSEMQVRDIMIPRADMVVLQRDAAPEAMLPAILDSGHSRFPVIGDSRDEVVGVLLAKDLLRYFANGAGAHRSGGYDPKEMLRPPVFIPEAKRLNVLLKEFRAGRNHMAIVVDEYGGVAGLVTIEDVLEQIVGEIDDEHDYEEEGDAIRRHGPRRYIAKARTEIEEFNAYFDADLSDQDFDTLGGLVTHALGRLPKRGETARVQGFDFKVLRADSRRVHLLRVTPAAEDAVADQGDET